MLLLQVKAAGRSTGRQQCHASFAGAVLVHDCLSPTLPVTSSLESCVPAYVS